MVKQCDFLNQGLNKSTESIIQLYHGSKSGIQGAIAPLSRDACDFGRGFYTGTMREQAFSLVCDSTVYPRHKFYTVSFNPEGLNMVRLEGLQWLFFIVYNRSDLRSFLDFDLENSTLFSSIASARAKMDVCVGAIADDKMPQAVSLFADDLFTDVALYTAMRQVQLGDQFVGISRRGCAAFKATEVTVGPDELRALRDFDEEYRVRSEHAYRDAQKSSASLGGRFSDLCRDFENKTLWDLPASWDELLRRYRR